MLRHCLLSAEILDPLPVVLFFNRYVMSRSLQRHGLLLRPHRLCQASLSFTVSQSLFRLMSIESVMPSNHLILDCPLLLLPTTFPSIRVFSNELALHIRWPKYWNFTL